MCGRFSLIQSGDEDLMERFHAKKFAGVYTPRYNIAPTQTVLTVLNQYPDTISLAYWGLIPFWAKDQKIGNRMINARAETLTEKPAFRGPIKNKRCLILADGFYEWQKQGKGPKIPFRITLKDGAPFAFAGIWDIWKDELVSCSIITTRSNSLVGRIHDRMPVILHKEDEKKWLSETKLPDVIKMLVPYESKRMSAYRISTLINSPANDLPEVIKSE